MSSAEVEVNGQDLIDFATSYDNLSDELRSIVARGLPVTEASPEDVPKVKSLLVAGGVIMEEFIVSVIEWLYARVSRVNMSLGLIAQTQRAVDSTQGQAIPAHAHWIRVTARQIDL